VEGPKDVTLEEWVVIVKELQEIWIGKHGEYQVRDMDKTKELEDEWVKWNTQRDSLFYRR